MKSTVVLVILDGWGLGESNESNPIYLAQPKTIRIIETMFPSGALQASGIAVGLPWEEEGNSEVGHLTIGAGKILYQHFPRISIAINDGTFFENKTLQQTFEHATKNKGAVHLVGLLTDGNVHATFEHLAALIQMAKQRYARPLYLHVITDGRDSAPRGVSELIKKLENIIRENKNTGVIESICGRYYAMDRDGHWDRIEKAYRLLTEHEPASIPLEKALQNTYGRNLDDAFIEPTHLGEPHPIESNDAILFFNFREDSMRQITAPFLDPSFNQFTLKRLENIFVTTFTAYDTTMPAHVVFPNETVEEPLGKVLSDMGKIQLRIAETEKYAHVTYFFNALREEPYPNEYRILVPSQSVRRHDEHPEMMARTIADRTLLALTERNYDCIVVNFANPDLIAHTGNHAATIEAIKVVDEELGRIAKAVIEENHTLLVTADHGNAEVLLDQETGEPETKHNVSPVPLYLVAQKFKKTKQVVPDRPKTIGMLADIAPTILELMNIKKPVSMTGQSLLETLISDL